MSKSILQDKKECYFCHSVNNLQLHHIYGGSRRNISDKNGFTVYLCLNHHTGNEGVHTNRNDLLRQLQRECEEKYLETHSLEEWFKLMRKNYL